MPTGIKDQPVQYDPTEMAIFFSSRQKKFRWPFYKAITARHTQGPVGKELKVVDPILI